MNELTGIQYNNIREEHYPFEDSSLRTFTKKRYRYVGKEKDAESGLYYYGARYYSAWTCRFVSVDPLADKYAQLSPYNYADNNPVGDLDVDGMQNTTTEKTETNDTKNEDQKDKEQLQKDKQDYKVARGAGATADDRHEDGEARGSCGQVWQCSSYNEDGSRNNDNGWVRLANWKSVDNIKLVPTRQFTENMSYFQEIEEESDNVSTAGLVLTTSASSTETGNPYGIAIGGIILAGTMSYIAINAPHTDILGESIDVTYDRVVLPTQVGTLTMDPQFAIPVDYTSTDGVNTIVGTDGMITIFRGVPALRKNGTPNPAYSFAIDGVAVPQGGTATPLEVNFGKPSNFTFWSTSPFVAYSFATRKGTGTGIVLVLRIPFGMVMPNASSDKFHQGELQLPTVEGAIPVIVN